VRCGKASTYGKRSDGSIRSFQKFSLSFGKNRQAALGALRQENFGAEMGCSAFFEWSHRMKAEKARPVGGTGGQAG